MRYTLYAILLSISPHGVTMNNRVERNRRGEKMHPFRRIIIFAALLCVFLSPVGASSLEAALYEVPLARGVQEALGRSPGFLGSSAAGKEEDFPGRLELPPVRRMNGSVLFSFLEAREEVLRAL
ncbi:MAG: hypothetical protein GF408_02650 [Candidatus Omnitrophica bacterium]|nr:hypothetical protein [Candidatus Omnitrophota bacterium]